MVMNLWYKYEKWLLKYIGFKNKNYTKLIDTLHSIDFMYIVPNDVNRLVDGLYIRKIFAKEEGVSLEDFEGRQCSILEMLVAFSDRVYYEYTKVEKDNGPSGFFWEMIENLKLVQFSDDKFDRMKVEKILKIWICREFSSDGKGSIFPMKFTRRDQRKVEIFSQMNEYLMLK